MDYNGKRFYNIPHFSDYMITNDGIILRVKDFKLIKYESYLKKSGFQYRIYDDNKNQIRININELLMLTFYGITNLPIKEKVKIESNEYEMIHVSNLYYDDTLLREIKNKEIDKFTILEMEYRLIPDTNNMLFINEDGAVYNFHSNKFIKKVYGKDLPYPKIHTTFGDNKEYQKNIHRILGMVFLDDFKPELYVNHKDAHMFNSFVSNLEMVTPQENVIHASENGLIGKAYRPEEIHNLCKLLEDQTSLYDIQKIMKWEDLNIKTITRLIYRICNRGQWKEISSLYDLSKYKKVNNYPKKFLHEDIHKVCKLLQDTDMSNKEISKETGIPADSIQSIRAGKQWLEVSSLYNINYSKKIFRIEKDEIHTVCKYLEEGKSNAEISRITGINEHSIRDIRNNKCKAYDNITLNYNIEKSKPKNILSEDQVEYICKLILEGKSNLEIANIIYPDKERFDQTISDIRKGRSFKDITNKFGIPNDKFIISPNSRQYITPEQKSEAIRLIKENPGLGNIKISNMVLGVPSYMIKHYRSQLKYA